MGKKSKKHKNAGNGSAVNGQTPAVAEGDAASDSRRKMKRKEYARRPLDPSQRRLRRFSMSQPSTSDFQYSPFTASTLW